jgi:ankyrin repeat protein
MWNACVNLIKTNNHEQLKKEIKRNPDLVSLVGDYSITLVMKCADHASYECLVVLVEYGANVNLRTKSGDTALQSSVWWRNFNISQYLLQQGAEVSQRDSSGDSAFDYAIYNDTKDGKNKWFKLFVPYKDHFDARDLALYKTIRLKALFEI